MFSKNGTGKAWIFARNIKAGFCDTIENQASYLKSIAEGDGYSVIGMTAVKLSVKSQKDSAAILQMLEAAEAKKMDAVYVVNIKHISEDYRIAYDLVDKLNRCGVVVYDSDGYDYSYDWVYKECCRANCYSRQKRTVRG